MAWQGSVHSWHWSKATQKEWRAAGSCAPVCMAGFSYSSLAMRHSVLLPTRAIASSPDILPPEKFHSLSLGPLVQGKLAQSSLFKRVQSSGGLVHKRIGVQQAALFICLWAGHGSNRSVITQQQRRCQAMPWQCPLANAEKLILQAARPYAQQT